MKLDSRPDRSLLHLLLRRLLNSAAAEATRQGVQSSFH